jgi:hypothetical protein
MHGGVVVIYVLRYFIYLWQDKHEIFKVGTQKFLL